MFVVLTKFWLIENFKLKKCNLRFFFDFFTIKKKNYHSIISNSGFREPKTIAAIELKFWPNKIKSKFQ